MMKRYLLIYFCIGFTNCFISQNSANSNAWKEENSVITIGYGAPNFFKVISSKAVKLYSNNHKNNSSDNISFSSNGFGPAFLKYEYGLSKIVGIGAVLGYWNTNIIAKHDYVNQEYDNVSGVYYDANYNDVIKFKISSLSLGARLNVHFATTEKVDPYIGFGAGLNINHIQISETSTNPNYLKKGKISFGVGIPLYLAFTVGMRYYFTDNIGIYGEIGVDKLAIIQGGLAIKI